jgi:hypothetical protein
MGKVSRLIIFPALMLLFAAEGWSCQIEYSDWLVNVFRQQGMSLDKRVGNYASLAECEAALREAVRQSADPNLANNMYCVDCPATSAPSNSAPAPSSAGEFGASDSGQVMPRQNAKNQDAFDQGKQELLQSLKGSVSSYSGLGLKTSGSTGAGLALKTGSPPPAPTSAVDASPLVRKEQDAFDRTQAEWLRKQQALIRQSVAQDSQWRKEVLASIKARRIPGFATRPKELDDLRPGDVLLIGPDNSATARTIKNLDPLYRALDYFAAGNVSAPELKQGRATHVLTFVKRINGTMLFLDHTLEGSRVLNEEGLMRQYANRLAYIAKPQAKVDGRTLWEAAREVALKKESDYGLFGKSVVCSERAAIAIAKATGQQMDKENHAFGIWGPIDVTPSDFFDDKHVGKFFLVSTYPILLNR